MERQDSKNTAFLQSSFRFLDHHKTVKSVISLLFAVKHIRIDNKIKSVIIKILTVIFSSLYRNNTADLAYVIQALLIDIHGIHFAFLTKSMCSRK